MKRKNNLFLKVIDFENILLAYKKSLKGSGYNKETEKFYFNSEKELIRLIKEIKEGTYYPEKYRYFKIYDPKERIISVAKFRDRVVHHAIVNILEPIFEKVFIFNSYATRKDKGTHKAIEKAQNYLRKTNYYLKADIRKYFDSIEHNILINLIEKKIKDKKLMELIKRIVKNSDISRGEDINKGLPCGIKLFHNFNFSSGKIIPQGLPIGNLTSQFFANIYLNGFDHFVKEYLRERYYIRYMDDFVIFSDNKERLKELRGIIKEYLIKELNLELKEKATYINKKMNGLSFLGVRIFPKLIRIKNENIKRIRKRIDKREKEYFTGKIDEKRYIQSLMSFFGYMNNFNTYELRRSIL